MRERLTNVLAILGGLRPVDASAPPWAWAMALPLWWTALLLLALAFAGQAVKFVYIDF